MNWSCLLLPVVVRPKDANEALLHTWKVKGQGDALRIQVLCQLWTKAASERSWQRMFSPCRNRKEERRKYGCILHVLQNICLELHSLLYVLKF